MAIDTSGEWWTGADSRALAEYIRLYTEDEYPAERIVQALCSCGGSHFRLRADADEGCARRACSTRGKSAFIADSGEFWGEADPRAVRCPCGNGVFEVGVGFSLRAGEVRWVTVGERCVRCGVLGSCADWKIDYNPSGHLLDMA
jgi:hypothetical protein